MNDWEIIRELGSGGQGTVHLVRSHRRVQERLAALASIGESLRPFVGGYGGQIELEAGKSLADAIFKHETGDRNV